VMCQYLFAAFSLKRTTDEGVTEVQLERIRAWEEVIVEVAVDEMLHLALATNLLTAVGAPPHLGRPDFPILSGWYPPGVRMVLMPFGERALQHFIHLEKPDGMEVADAIGFGAPDQPEPDRPDDLLMPEEQDWSSVGHLYRSIEAGLETLAARDGEDRVLIGPVRAQARWQAFRWHDITPVRTLADARAAIEVIIEAGEGARGDWEQSHFGRFVGILNELRAMRAADPGFEPARPCVPAYVEQLDTADAPVTVATDPLTVHLLDLGDATYLLTLQLLSRFFLHTTESNEQLEALARSAVRLMAGGLRPIGIALTTLPVGPAAPGRTAGLGFAIPSPTQVLLPHRDAAWIVLTHRAAQLAERARELAAETGIAGLAAAAERMAAVAEHLARVAPARHTGG
ncbi:MAG: ferritin-like domain-containing protein, partial [Chloroflexota bacterium]